MLHFIPNLQGTTSGMPDSWDPLGRSRRNPGGPEAWALLAALDQPAAVVDAAGWVLRANPALRGLAGPARPLADGAAFAAVVDAAHRPGFGALLEQAAAGSAGIAEMPLLALPGPPAPCLRLHALPLPPGLVLLRVENLTETVQATAADEAAERFTVIGRIAGGIAHDFNNLLGVIRGGAEDALALGVSPEVAADLTAITGAAERGAGLVRALLAAARQQVLLPRPVALAEALAEAAPLLRRLLGARIELRLALEEWVRPVRMDPSQLDQVLLNLAANARDALPEGGRITMHLAEALVLSPEIIGQTRIPPGRWVTLTVQDTGPGIPAALLPHVLEPFVTSRRGRGGTGLGLATVDGILRQSGGHLAVESPPGEGARFTLFLPRAEAEPAPAPPFAPPPPPPPPTAMPAGRLLLLVEDEAPLRRLSARALRRQGFMVTEAEDAEAALALVEAGLVPALLVSDVSLPGLDGLALARRLRHILPGLPALLVSGYAEAALDADLGAESMAFLAKPFSPAELLAAAQEACIAPDVRTS